MKRKRTIGFTLIELLTVIAIIGILAGILIPTVGAAQNAMSKAKSKVTFTGWMTALQQYKSEYGYYPDVGNLQKDGVLEFNLRSNTEDFIKAMTGRKIDGSALSNKDRKKFNRKAIPFYSFNQNEFDEKTGTKLVDAFLNPNIFIVVDHDGDGILDTNQFKKAAKVSEDIKGSSVAYALKSDNIDYKDVFTWK